MALYLVKTCCVGGEEGFEELAPMVRNGCREEDGLIVSIEILWCVPPFNW